jgi:Sec-independent protein secretion pathway component TatC
MRIALAVGLLAWGYGSASGPMRPPSASGPPTFAVAGVGALASGMLLYGMSMLYGATGSLDINEVAKQIATLSKDSTQHAFLVFGLVFELPLVMTALARARIVPAAVFKKYRRHMWVIILIVAALVTSPDILTQVMVGIPLIIFYELSLVILRFTAPADKPEKKTAQTPG